MNVKSKLLAKNRRVVKKVTIERDGEPVEVAICKPTMGDRAQVIDAAKEAGEIDAKGEPTSTHNAMRMSMRVVAVTLFDAATKQPIFGPSDVDDLLAEDWTDEVLPDCQAVFAPDAEKLKGK